MSLTIDVYTTENCPACQATVKWLDSRGIEYRSHDAADWVGFLKSLGFAQAPVVIVYAPDNAPVAWSRFKPDQLSQYCKAGEGE